MRLTIDFACQKTACGGGIEGPLFFFSVFPLLLLIN